MDEFTGKTLMSAGLAIFVGMQVNYWADGADLIKLHQDIRNFEFTPIELDVQLEPLVPTYEMPEAPAAEFEEWTLERFGEAERREIECLALNAYHEARGSTVSDMVATAYVVLNRVDDPRYPNTACEVVWEHRQFSWTHDGRSDFPYEYEAWSLAQIVARNAYTRNAIDETNGSTHYYATYVRPYWAEYATASRQIGQHHYVNLSTR